jgi:uracil-DNA glycosylase
MRLIDKIRGCTLCQELAETRTNVVVGEGPVPCRLVFLGEAPGEKEDLSGRPFIGRSGQLQTALAAAVGLRRGVDYHVLNVIKCRPPENRDPTPEELENCRPYLLRQLKAIKPQAIVAFGKYAQAFVLGVDPKEVKPTKRAGEIIEAGEAKAILTFHPAYVMRSNVPEVRSAFIRHLRKAKRLCAV